MKIVIMLLLSLSLYADVKQEMLSLYENGYYKDACMLGYNNSLSYDKDENFISLYGFACLKSDYIDRLILPITKLKNSAEARSNGAYFSIIMTQKKLLYHSLIDGYKLSSLKLPSTDYILSKVFDLYSELTDEEQKEVYLFEDKYDKKLTYKLFLRKDEEVHKMVIEELYDKMIIKSHVYW